MGQSHAVCTAGSLTPCYLRKNKKAVLALSTSFSVRMHLSICQGRGRGWREWWFGRHFWEHFWLQTTAFGFTKETVSWPEKSWKVLGWVPLCSSATTVRPTGAANRVSRHFFMSTACFLHAHRNWAGRKVFCTLTNKLWVNEGHLATTQSNYLKEVRSLSSFFILFS